MASQRQLRVGEEIRHILSGILFRNSWPQGELPTSVTVTRVDMSPDLQNAIVFVMPLGGEHLEETLIFLKEMSPFIRKTLAGRLTLRRVPTLKFVIDDTFEKAEKMEALFRKIQKKEDDNS